MSVKRPLKIQTQSRGRVFNSWSAWRTVGEKRIYFRSRWEYLYALYLQWQKEQKIILEWDYESKCFWFENIKRGVRSYKPDFWVKKADGEHFYVEVKGFMDAKSKTKIRRFKLYFPEEKLKVVDKSWFERRAIRPCNEK